MHESTSDFRTEQPEASSSFEDWVENRNEPVSGSSPSNTDPENPQVVDCSSVKCHANGCDWMAFNAFSLKPLPDGIFDTLAAKKRLAKQNPEKPVTMMLAGLEWTVDARPFGKGLNHFEHQLRGGFLRLGISTQTSEKAPQAFIEATGRFCGGKCPEKLLKVLKSIVQRSGVDAYKHKFTRLDVHADFSGLPASLLYSLYRSGRMITRAGKVKEENVRGCVTGSTFATAGALMLRCYDKNKELNGDAVRVEEYLARIGATVLPVQNTRIEVQVCSDYIRSRGLGNTDDVMASAGVIFSEILTNWIRVVDREVSRHNSQRQKSAAWWQVVSDSICGCLNNYNEVSREPSKVASFESAESLLVMGVSSYLEKFGVSFGTMRESLAFIMENVSSSLDKRQQDATESKVLKRSQIENEQRLWNESRDSVEVVE